MEDISVYLLNELVMTFFDDDIGEKTITELVETVIRSDKEKQVNLFIFFNIFFRWWWSWNYWLTTLPKKKWNGLSFLISKMPYSNHPLLFSNFHLPYIYPSPIFVKFSLRQHIHHRFGFCKQWGIPNGDEGLVHSWYRASPL